MLGEHRPALADLLWERAQLIIKSLDMADVSTESHERMQDTHEQNEIIEIQKDTSNNNIKKDSVNIDHN